MTLYNNNYLWLAGNVGHGSILEGANFFLFRFPLLSFLVSLASIMQSKSCVNTEHVVVCGYSEFYNDPILHEKCVI